MHVTDQLGQYDMILGRDLLQEIGINLDFKENNISWVDYQADMKDVDVTLAEHIAMVETTTTTATEIAKILDAKYHKKHEELFDGTLGMWKNFQYDIELQEGVKPYLRRPYMLPKAYEDMLCTEGTK
eukprot:11037372-Ditylum_brightwellii.AAC.1